MHAFNILFTLGLFATSLAVPAPAPKHAPEALAHPPVDPEPTTVLRRVENKIVPPPWWNPSDPSHIDRRTEKKIVPPPWSNPSDPSHTDRRAENKIVPPPWWSPFDPSHIDK